MLVGSSGALHVSGCCGSAVTLATQLCAIGVAIPRGTLFERMCYSIAEVIEPAVLRKLVISADPDPKLVPSSSAETVVGIHLFLGVGVEGNHRFG